MARAVATDYFHAFKFHMRVSSSTVAGAKDVGAQGGFTSVTMPEITVETAEYQEGVMLYKRKFPGQVSFSDVTAMRGTVKKDTDLYTWIRSAYLGKEYRVDAEIRHYHRDEVTDATSYVGLAAKRKVSLFEAMPTRVKLGSDLDGSTSDISVEEVDLAYEYAEFANT